MKTIQDTLFYIVIAWNIVVFVLYGIDKWNAAHNGWRTPEATLILTAFLFGGTGAVLGMVAFHHKVSKIGFRILVPFAVVINITAIKLITIYLPQIIK